MDSSLRWRKSKTDNYRWIFLDVGRFNGLAETEREAIKYHISVPRLENEICEKAIIAGPTCDSVDTLYERTPVEMPINLQAGDKVWVHATGAYTSTYSSVGFNGFTPLDVYSVEEVIRSKYSLLETGWTYCLTWTSCCPTWTNWINWFFHPLAPLKRQSSSQIVSS